jgi:gas vesicle protein
MRALTGLIGGAVVGAAAALLFAPRSGAATRSLLRDKATHLGKEATEFAEGKGKHLRNKMEGYAHAAQDLTQKAQVVAEKANEVLPQVREMIDHAVGAVSKARASAAHPAEADPQTIV